jgi:hypothetical protein
MRAGDSSSRGLSDYRRGTDRRVDGECQVGHRDPRPREAEGYGDPVHRASARRHEAGDRGTVAGRLSRPGAPAVGRRTDGRTRRCLADGPSRRVRRHPTRLHRLRVRRPRHVITHLRALLRPPETAQPLSTSGERSSCRSSMASTTGSSAASRSLSSCSTSQSLGLSDAASPRERSSSPQRAGEPRNVHPAARRSTHDRQLCSLYRRLRRRRWRSG